MDRQANGRRRGSGPRGAGDRGNPTHFCNGRKRGWRTKVARELGLLQGIDREVDERRWDRALRDRQVDEFHPKIEPGNRRLRVVSQFQDLYCSRTPGWGTYHTGVGRCRRCGGTTPVGSAHPSYKDGSRSKANWLLNEIDSVDVGREIGDLDRQIRSADFREQEIYRSLQNVADTPELRFAAENAVEVLAAAIESLWTAFPYNALVFEASMTRLMAVRDDLDESLEHAGGRSEAWREIREIQEHKRKLSLAKTRKDVHGDVIRREMIEMLGVRLMGVMTAIVDEFVPDLEDRQEAIARLAGGVAPFLPGIVAGDPPPAHRLLEAD